jgi:soluble lytic murein transglycosylase
MDPGKYDNLLTFASRIAKGEPITTNWGLYYSLASDHQLLKRTNLGALRSQLGDTEFKQLTEDQTKLNNPRNEDMTHLQGAREVLNSFLRQAGIDPTPEPSNSESSDAAKVGRFQAAFQQLIDARERVTGKKLSTTELQEEAAQLFTPVSVPSPWWGTDKKPLGLVKPGETVVVPDDDRVQIEAALKRAGRPVTDDAILTWYAKNVGLVKGSVTLKLAGR